MSKIKTLIVDDDRSVLDSLSMYLEPICDIVKCFCIKDAFLHLIAPKNIDIAIIDLSFPGAEDGGLRLINYIGRNKLKVKPIIYTAYPGSVTPEHLNHSYGVIQKGKDKSYDLLFETVLFTFANEKVFIQKKRFKNLSLLPNNSNEIVEESLKIMNWAVKNNHKQVCSLNNKDDIYRIPFSCDNINSSKIEKNEIIIERHNKIEIVISYSKKEKEEENFCKKISNELKPLEHDDIFCWFDEKIKGGEDWDEIIKTKFQDSHIIICVISKKFLESEYILTKELPIIKQKIEHNLHVIPILYNKCRCNVVDWVLKRQLLNKAQPYSECIDEKQEETLNELIARIKELAKTIRSEK